ncbi:Transcription factor, fungi [Penicillium expansum]|nr:Transcription factor, fungi [Penicillium expansum]KGO50060.1 Transcription factor, fungi [Penicillium expansum]
MMSAATVVDSIKLAYHSVLACDIPTQPTISEESLSHSNRITDAILATTEAAVLPVAPLRRALTDAFFEQVFHNYPVINPEDISNPNPSILLQQGVCLAGSLMRDGPTNLQLSRSLYDKVKTLIYLNYEPDDLATLKTMCLLSCWSVKPPDKISLDGPWYWTGVASRLAIQMGLHRESTYTNNPQNHCLRRIFWQLYSSDKLQVACWGRPPSFSSRYITVKPPVLEDFEIQNVQALVFIHTTKLCTIIGNIAELHLERRPVPFHEVFVLSETLCGWVREIPHELCLYNSEGGRNEFNRPVSELFIKYFAAIILLQLLQNEVNQQRRTTVRSLVAASCMAKLYEEIHYREQTCYLLPIHGFLCMVASLPQIYYQPQSAEKNRTRKEELDILRSIMGNMRGKYGGATMILAKIQRLEKEVKASTDRYLLEADAVGLSSDGILHDPSESLGELFPFPPTACAHMDFIKQSGETQQGFLPQDFVPMEDEWAKWLVSEGHNFVDLFGMYSGAYDVEEPYI